MKKVRFIRHYKLKPPFDHWQNMSLTNFIEFTKGIADPMIEEFDKVDILKCMGNVEWLPELFVVSTKIRTIETANMLNNIMGKRISITASNLFDEIPSRFTALPTAKEFEAMKCSGKLYVKKERILSDQEKLDRIIRIDEFIDKILQKNLWIVSHSYLIGLLNYWFCIIKRNSKQFDPQEAERHEMGGVLKGFETFVE